MLLSVLTEPDARLRVVSEKIKEVDDDVRQIMQNLLETMHHEDGIGIAAPQVGINKRIIVIGECDDEERPEDFFPLFIANPQIIVNLQTINSTIEEVTAQEGCLSIPGQRVDVTRPKAVTVKFLNYRNEEQIISSSGWLARVLQHEIDHLDGKLIIDYLVPSKLSTSKERELSTTY